MHKKRAIIYLTIFYIILVTLLSLAPISAAPALDVPNQDKVVHACFYLVLNLLLLRCVNRVSFGSVVMVTSISILYGITIEYIQPFMGRNYDTKDIAANSIGAVVGALLFIAYRGVFRAKRS